jgi:glycerol-3-phosphate acyltransferase PlsY
MLASLQLSPSLGAAMGLGPSGTLTVFALVLLTAWLASIVPVNSVRALLRSITIAALGALLLLGLLWMAKPQMTKKTLLMRVFVSCLSGYHDQAAMLCKTYGGRFERQRCACRLPTKRAGRPIAW